MAELNLVDVIGLKLPASRPTECRNCIIYGDDRLTQETCPTCPDYLKLNKGYKPSQESK